MVERLADAHFRKDAVAFGGVDGSNKNAEFQIFRIASGLLPVGNVRPELFDAFGVGRHLEHGLVSLFLGKGWDGLGRTGPTK